MEGPNAPILQADGTYRNTAGQICDEHGQLIALAADPIRVVRQAPGHVDRHYGRQQPVGAGNADNARTLAEYNRPDLFYANRSAIRLPTIQRNDFELKPAFYSLVGQHPFSGLPNEHPMDHIENFEDLASSIKANGVSMDYLHCKLFPHSLSGEASAWLKNLEPGSLTTWEETKNAFLCNFYDDARSEELRKKISTFSQGPAEAFKAAWVRFRSYQKDCPHHGFSNVQLLGIFYRGVDWQHQMALDAASNGNFNTRYPTEALQLIENLSQANSTKNADLERKKLAGNGNEKEIAAVNAKIDTIANFLMGKKSVNFADHVETIGLEQQVGDEDVNYVNGAGFQQGNGGYNNTSYNRNYGNSSYQAPPPQNDESTKAMFEQLLEGQQTLTVTLNGKIDNIYTNLNDKIETLTIHVKKLDVQAAQTAETIKRQESSLPGKSHSNPKDCNAVSSHDKETARIEAMFTKLLDGQQQLATNINCKIDAVYSTLNGKIEEVHNYVQKLEARISQGSDQPMKQCVDRHTIVGVDRQPSGNQNENRYQPSVAPSTLELSVDRHTHAPVDRHDPRAALPYVVIPPSVKSNDYAPKVPYPRPHRSKQEIEDEKCKAMLDKIKTKVPLSDNEDTSSPMKRLVKRMVLNGLTPEEGALLTRDTGAVFSAQPPKKTKEKKEKVSKQSSALIQRKFPPKLPDPGRFVLDCSISTARFSHSLCDLGSSINLMPLSVALRLGMTAFKPCTTSILFADRSQRFPEGILEDVPVKVSSCVIPTDFVVLRYATEPIDPLILGRPFLATAGAKIDVKKGTMQLDLGDVVMDFDMEKLRKTPTIDGMTFSVVTSDDITAGYVDKLSLSEQAAQPEDSSEMCCRKHSDIEHLETLCRSTRIPCVDRHHAQAERDTSKKAVSRDVLQLTSPTAAPRQKAPHLPLPSPREKPRYTNSHPPPPNIINKNFRTSNTALPLTKPRDSRRGLVCSFDECVGKRSIPPIPQSHPSAAIPVLFGRSPAPNAYKPPWMRRHLSQRHSLPLSDPPDL